MQEFALKKWWILFAASAVVVGCAGGVGSTSSTTGGAGTGTTGTGTTGTTGLPTRSVPLVNLPNTLAEVRVSFLSGQGRRAPGSQFAKLNFLRMRIGGNDIIPTEFNGSTDGINVQLDGFTTNKYGFGQSITATKTYQLMNFDVTNMYEEQLDGTLSQLFAGSFPITNIPVNAPVVPGRQTNINIYLNNASLTFDNTFQQPAFDVSEFNLENGLTGSNRIQGFLSDMVAFDISGVATRPGMNSGGSADKFMLSGDSLGLARSVGFDGSFDLFSPNFVESGVLTNPVILPDGTAPGTYNVLEPDPSVIPPAITRITALQGTWRNVNDIVTNLGTSGILIFPTTRAGQPHMAVAYTRSGSTINGLWFGNATLAGNSGTVQMWPVSQANVVEASRTGGFTGTLTVVTSSGGKVVDGDFALTGAPSGLSAAGTFAIIQK
jgi:hypothetical protein